MCLLEREEQKEKTRWQETFATAALPPPYSLSKQMQNYDENDAFEKRPKLGNCNRWWWRKQTSSLLLATIFALQFAIPDFHTISIVGKCGNQSCKEL